MNTNRYFRTLSQVITAAVLLFSFPAAQAQYYTGSADIASMISGGKASVSSVPAVPMNVIQNMFDDNTESMCIVAQSPFTFTIEFTAVPEVTAASIMHATGDASWKLEAANTKSDMDSQTGSYQLLFSRTNSIGNQHHLQTFASPLKKKMIKVTAYRSDNPNEIVHIRDFKLYVKNMVSEIFCSPSSKTIAAEPGTVIPFKLYGKDQTTGIIYKLDSQKAQWQVLNTSLASVSAAGLLTTKSAGNTSMNVSFTTDDAKTVSKTYLITVISSTAPAVALPPRGTAGDGWADVVIGQKDFTQISTNEVTPYAMHRPGGVAIDRRDAANQKVYVWDSGNNRVIGASLNQHTGEGMAAELVLGQPSLYRCGACNLESAYQKRPERIPASASTLCAQQEGHHTPMENKTMVGMALDNQGNLYVPDFMNHRLLMYKDPFNTDAVADEVWGQPDFQSNGANITGKVDPGYPGAPNTNASNASLCFFSASGAGGYVYIDPSGNLWVADAGNARVLRFPLVNGKISKTANLVLGQKGFNNGGDGSHFSVYKNNLWEGNSNTDRMFEPKGMIVYNNTLYVCDHQNNRILTFSLYGLKSGAYAKSLFGNLPDVINPAKGKKFAPFYIKESPDKKGFLITAYVDHFEYNGKNISNVALIKTDYTGNVLDIFPMYGLADGGFDFDIEGNIYTAPYDVNNLIKHKNNNGIYEYQAALFKGTSNSPSDRSLVHPNGLEVTNDQLIVQNRKRIYFWNNKNQLSNGLSCSGIVGADNIDTESTDDIHALAADKNNRLWCSAFTNSGTEIRMYSLPLTNKAQPAYTIKMPLKLMDGSGLAIGPDGMIITGMAVEDNSQFLWLADPDNHRVFRIRNPLTNPQVDIILGQSDKDGTQCNRGVIGNERGGNGSWVNDKGIVFNSKFISSMLCAPGALSLDRNGNLFVSDSYLETSGNYRLLAFSAAGIQNNGSTLLLAVAPSVAYNLTATWQPAFNSKNEMFVGQNIYHTDGGRYIYAYKNPLNPTKQLSYLLNDWVTNSLGARFDENDNLYVIDANNGRVLIYKNPGLIAPVANFKADATTTCPGGEVRFTDLSVNSPMSWEWTAGNGSKSYTSTAQHPVFYFDTPGSYTITLKASNASGSNTKTVANYIYVVTGAALPYAEGFESASYPPAGWSLYNPDNGNRWKRGTVSSSGGFGKSSNYTVFDNGDFGNMWGQKDQLQTPVFDMRSTPHPVLKFDVAHKRFNNYYVDTLVVYATSNCGINKEVIYKKWGNELSSSPGDYIGIFYPKANEWRTETIDLWQYNGRHVSFIFENISGYGQLLYVDNVQVANISGGLISTEDIDEKAIKMMVYPNPNQGRFTLALKNSPQANFVVTVYNGMGQEVYSVKVEDSGTEVLQSEIDLSHLQKGIYIVKATNSTNGNGQVNRIIVR